MVDFSPNRFFTCRGSISEKRDWTRWWRVALGWARVCLSVSDRVCLHDASVCLSMGAFGGVGPAPCLCVSDHVCLIVCVFMMPLCV